MLALNLYRADDLPSFTWNDLHSRLKPAAGDQGVF